MKVQLGRSPSNSIIRIETKENRFRVRSQHARYLIECNYYSSSTIYFSVSVSYSETDDEFDEIPIRDKNSGYHISSNSIIFEKISLAYFSSRNLSNFARETIEKIDFEIVCDPKNESLRRKIYSSARGDLFLCFSRCFRRTKRCFVYLMHR